MIKEEMKNEEMETEVVNDEDITIEGEEEMKKNLFTKEKNFITKNKKKILAVGLTLVGGAVGYALGSKGSGNDDYSPLENNTSNNQIPTLENSDSEGVENEE